MFCLGCSSVFHLFSAYSQTVNKVLARLDYAGVAILIGGSFCPIIYYIFYCRQGMSNVEFVWIYLCSMCLSCIAVFVVSLAPFFQKRKYRWFRGSIFLTLGLMGVIPLTHIIFLYIQHRPEFSVFITSLLYFFMMGISYIVGVIIYIVRVPERFYPGKFDTCGSSHNIWHCFVLAAAIFHYFGSLESFHIREWTTCEALV